jgi:hypothetical protein
VKGKGALECGFGGDFQDSREDSDCFFTSSWVLNDYC